MPLQQITEIYLRKEASQHYESTYVDRWGLEFLLKYK